MIIKFIVAIFYISIALPVHPYLIQVNFSKSSHGQWEKNSIHLQGDQNKGHPQVLLRQGNYKGIELFHQPDEIIGHYGPKAKCHVRIKTFAPSFPFVEVKLSLKSFEKQFYSKMQSVSAILSTNTILHHKIHAKFKTPTVQMLMFL